jgi:DNA adenine methylase
MQYFGGKTKIAQSLAQFLNSVLEPGQLYWEPFCGGLSVASLISGPRPVLLSDSHGYLIDMWIQAFKDPSIFPDQVSKEQYDRYKKWTPINFEGRAVKGFIGFGCSFGGKWYGGYARDSRGGGQNFANRAQRGVMEKVARFRSNGNEPIFLRTGYQEYNIPRDLGAAVIYCDPPYWGTTGYSLCTGFDTDQFNQWVRGMSQIGHRVLVSEYAHNAPDDARVLWSWESRKSFRDASGKQVQTTEILYTLH